MSRVVNDIPPHRPFATSPTSRVATLPSRNWRIGRDGKLFAKWKPLSFAVNPTRTLVISPPSVPQTTHRAAEANHTSLRNPPARVAFVDVDAVDVDAGGRRAPR